MNTGARIAAAVAAGYLLGRTRKMRLALMLAAAGLTGARGGSPAVLLKRVLSQLGSIPEVAELADTVKNELLGAAKTATVSAATKQVEAISGRMQGQLGGRSAEDDAEDDEEPPEPDDDEPEESPPPQRRRSPVRRSRR